MNEARLVAIRELIAQCTPEEQAALFRELRARHLIHEFEKVIGAPAEMILEAVHRAPELTRRMLRGVIADAAFRQFVILPLAAEGWQDVTPAGNFAFDYKVGDAAASPKAPILPYRVVSCVRCRMHSSPFPTATERVRML